jgi:ABC-type multidrug transport system fused ATPase/permease subunit
MVTNFVVKAFGTTFIDSALEKESREVLQAVATQKQATMMRIFRLFRPHAPRWMAGTIMLMCTETCTEFLASNLVAMVQLAYGIRPDTMVQTSRMIAILAVGFMFNWPFDTLGDTLVDGVESKVQLALRQAVLSSLLSQDREYFDHHQTGVLQERLNGDTEQLANVIIQLPKNLISATTRVVAQSTFLYRASPSLFWTCIGIPVPFCVILNTFAWSWVRQADFKIGKVNDHANGSTAEILREISTVRQFGMEVAEASRYITVARWREQLQVLAALLDR